MVKLHDCICQIMKKEYTPNANDVWAFWVIVSFIYVMTQSYLLFVSHQVQEFLKTLSGHVCPPLKLWVSTMPSSLHIIVL